MRRLILLALFFICSSGFAQTSAPEPAPLLTAVQAMPSEIKAKTFDHEAFSASMKQAMTDGSLDLPAVCHLLEADLGDTNPEVRGFTMVVLHELMQGRSNTEADRRLVASALLPCLESKDQNTQNVCVYMVTDAGMPAFAIAQFKDTAVRKIGDGTVYSALAVGLAHVAARWPTLNADAVLADFFRSPSVADAVKGKALFTLQARTLSDEVLDALAELLAKTKDDELKVQIIDSSYRIGSRALDREHDTLLALESDTSESQKVQQAARGVLLSSPHTAASGIH